MDQNRSIREVLTGILDGTEAIEKYTYAGLSDNEMEKLGSAGYRGKVRDLIFKGDEVELIHTDRLSAFDRQVGLAPLRGYILAAMTRYWLDKCGEVLPTYLTSSSDQEKINNENTSRSITGKKLAPVKIEVIVRGYLAGSMMRSYEKGERQICGITLPEGIPSYGKLDAPIVTPTTKAEVYEHDENITASELVKQGLATEKEWDLIRTAAVDIFNLGSKIYNEKGWILVDTKYEFGRDKDGKIYLIDEVHTPDSSRLWELSSYSAHMTPRMFDKDNVRRYLLDRGFDGHGDVPAVPQSKLAELSLNYLEVAESLLGKELKFTQ